MRPGPYIRGIALIAWLAGSAAVVRAQVAINDLNNFATYAGGYNLVSFGNATLSGSSDTEGGIAVGGNLSVGGSWTFASQSAPGSNPSFYVAGSQLSLSGPSHLNNGYASTPGLSSANWSWDGTQKQLSGGGGSLGINSSGAHTGDSPLTNPAPANWNWSSLPSTFQTISSDLAALAPTDSITVSGQNLTFSSSLSSGVAVFNLNAALLSGNTYNGQTISNIQINVPDGINYVINVTNLSANQTLFGSGVNFNSGSGDGRLLWNFEGSNNVTLSNGGNFYGSILAPDLTINDATTINGQVIANSFTDSGVELHYTAFAPSGPSVLVPEPRFYAWCAVGLCVAGAALGRGLRRRRAGHFPDLAPLASSVSK